MANFDEYDSTLKSDLLEREVFKIKSDDAWKFTEIYKTNGKEPSNKENKQVAES